MKAHSSSLLRTNWKPILTLLVVPAFAEVTSGAMSLIGFLSPAVFLPYVLLLYGVPILILREIMVRCRLGLVGLAVLGLLYGLYNEGLMAQTLFSPLDNPLHEYVSYGVVHGLRLPFTTFIIGWHALMSVVLPVVLVSYVYRSKAAAPWLPKPLTWVLGLAVLGLAIASFFGLGREPGEGIATTGLAIQYFCYLVGIAGVLLLATSKAFRNLALDINASVFSWRLVLYGAIAFILVGVVPYTLASLKVYWPLTILYFVAVGGWGVYAARTCKKIGLTAATCFVLGAGLVATIETLFGGDLLGGVIIAAVFCYVLWHARRKAFGSRVV